MTPEIGHFILWLALGLSVALGVVPLWGAQSGRTAWMTLARPGAWAVFALVVLSYIALTIAFVRDDFEVTGPVVAFHEAVGVPAAADFVW